MTRFLGYVVAGLANGTIYALVALGVVVVYRISRVVNLAHGAMGVFATFCFHYVFIGDWGALIRGARDVASHGAASPPVLSLVRRRERLSAALAVVFALVCLIVMPALAPMRSPSSAVTKLA